MSTAHITKYLFIEADSNDADYVSNLVPVTAEELDLLRPLISAIKNFKPYKGKSNRFEGNHYTHHHNFVWGGKGNRSDLGEKSPEELYVESGLASKDAFDLFTEQFLPLGGEYGIHSITRIKVYFVVGIEELL